MLVGARAVAAGSIACLVVLVAVNVFAPPTPDEEPSSHAKALVFQGGDTLRDLALAHGNTQINHYNGFYLTLGRLGSGSTLTVFPGMFGNEQDYLGFARMSVREDDDYDHELAPEELEQLLEKPHIEGLYAESRLALDPETTDYVIVRPSEAHQRDDPWRAMNAGDLVVIAPEHRLVEAEVAWE